MKNEILELIKRIKDDKSLLMTDYIDSENEEERNSIATINMEKGMFISDLEKIVNKKYESTISSGLGAKIATSAIIRWIESEDCWIEDGEGNKIDNALINGRNFPIKKI
jgi:hypothetical protein